MAKHLTLKTLSLFGVAPALLAATAVLPVSLAQKADKAPTAEATAFFTKEVKPLLEQDCLACHDGDKPMGSLKLTSREAILKGGVSGPAVVLAKPEESLLLKAVNYQGRQMPPAGKLAQKKIDTLTRWVKMGMPWAGSAGTAPLAHAGPPKVTPETMKFWSFQPVKPVKIPTVQHKEWVRSPIDAFVLKRLEAQKLTPNPPASPTALLRRAYYDLTGLPPTPAEAQAFLNDKSPHAYEKLVDKLLGSPRYGEKWGRHWLDLVRYAETNSYERDGHKPNAWRYRDYVIQSFNSDKPYDQFVTEQLAGDELPGPRTPERMIATGYYRLGLWDDEPADPEQALYDDLDDIASTTGQVFLGLTVNCARCHDHKLDPIPQKDYYRFLSFFNGVLRYGVRSPQSVFEASQRPIVPEEEAKKYREEIMAHEAKIRQNNQAIAAIEKSVRDDFSPVEKEEFQDDVKRPDILKKRVPSKLSQADFTRYEELRKERQRLDQNRPKALETALCVTEQGPTARLTHVLMRGNPHVEGEEVTPGFPSVLNPPAPAITPTERGDTSGRRLALARWITSKENPLTARVLVNRVWQYHFGRGLVRTSSNFGFQGTKPTHPELLDWLAAAFVERSDEKRVMSDEKKLITRHSSRITSHACGWQMKKLHRLIMLSNTYRMASTPNAKALAKDPENDLLWRFDMRRLQAEEVRDSILAVNSSLNLAMGGPSVYPDMPQAVLAGQSVPGAGWGKSTPEEQSRRSIYVYVKRSLTVPMIASFDGPETDFTCPIRFATTQPTQALGMLNSEFVNKEARVFADSIRKQVGTIPEKQVRQALWRVLQREPTAREIGRGVKLMADLQQQYKVGPDEALNYFCVVALNLNEFLYLD